MAQVMLQVGGRRYELACRDGEEGHLRQLGGIVDAKAGEAARAVGSGNEARQLLLAALLLADDMAERAARAEPVKIVSPTRKTRRWPIHSKRWPSAWSCWPRGLRKTATRPKSVMVGLPGANRCEHP